MASMRPRPDAAENPGEGWATWDEVDAASMRPRPDAAENLRHGAKLDAPVVQLQ